MSEMNVAIIPARGGSKRIPRKNVKPFRGRPMIAWAIEAALRSGMFAEVVVSTEDEEIRAAAFSHGAHRVLVRPDHLADDHTPTAPVIAHAVGELNQLGHVVDRACCIYPCSPTLQGSDLSRALEISRTLDAAFVYPVVEYAHPIQRAMRWSSDKPMTFVHPEHELSRTQDLERTFHDAGQFYMGQAKAWQSGMRMHSNGIGMPIESWRVVDIDTPQDWRRAELVVAAMEAARS